MRRFITVLLTFVLANLWFALPIQKSTADSALVGTGPTIVAGNEHTCVVQETGTVKCWGIRSWFGITSVPTDLGKATQLSAGEATTCALTDQAEVKCWGVYTDGQTNVPSDLGKVVQVTVGSTHACALNDQGLVKCWGPNSSLILVPAGLDNVTQIAGGFYHTCALTKEKTVTCWGVNGSGETNTPSGLGRVKQLTAGAGHTCALTDQSEVKCWGRNDYGQTNVPSDLGKVTQVTAGQVYTCVIVIGGKIRCWGSNFLGESSVPSGLGNATQLALGAYHACSVDELGGVSCWGNNTSGQTLVPQNLNKVLTFGPREFQVSSVPIINGESVPGGYLIAMTGDWDSGVTYTYQWIRDGVAIPAATSSSYTLQASDYLKKVSVAVTGSKEGYISETKTSNAVIPVKPKEKIASLRFTGTFKVGEKASVGPVNRNGKFDYSYQWLRGGVEIDGANSRTYLMGAEDAGANLSARVCALYLKDVTHCVSQDAGSAVQLGLLKNVKASISGVAKVGRMLNSTPVIFDKQATVAYQWLRNGDPIVDATRNSYFIDLLDKGSSISLRVTVSKPGYETEVKTSSSKLIN